MVGIFFAAGYGMYFFVKSFWAFVLATVIWTIGEIIHSVNVGVYIANHTPVSHRGRFSSIMLIVSETGGAISPYVMGAYISVFGVTKVWPVISLLSIIAAFSMFILGTAEKRKSAKAV
jgi:MFS family permease